MTSSTSHDAGNITLSSSRDADVTSSTSCDVNANLQRIKLRGQRQHELSACASEVPMVTSLIGGSRVPSPPLISLPALTIARAFCISRVFCTNGDFMQRRCTEHRINANIERCFVIGQCHGNSGFLTLTLTGRSVKRRCVKSPMTQNRPEFLTGTFRSAYLHSSFRFRSVTTSFASLGLSLREKTHSCSNFQRLLVEFTKQQISLSRTSRSRVENRKFCHQLHFVESLPGWHFLAHDHTTDLHTHTHTHTHT